MYPVQLRTIIWVREEAVDLRALRSLTNGPRAKGSESGQFVKRPFVVPRHRAS